MYSPSKIELFTYLANNLSIRVENTSEPPACGGAILGVKVTLLLIHPHTGEKVAISTDNCYLG